MEGRESPTEELKQNELLTASGQRHITQQSFWKNNLSVLYRTNWNGQSMELRRSVTRLL